MAVIKAFKAWRYNHFLAENLEELAAPLHESLLQQKQAAFYKFPYHYYHISSPIDAPPFENASRRIENWKLDKVIRQDAIPGIYVYYQYFYLHGEAKKYVRKGVICNIEAHDFSEKVVLPHEMTIKKAVDYRTSLLEYTKMHTLPTHGFYTDESCSLEACMEESMQTPLYTIEEKNGTIHKLSVIQDQKVIRKFQEVLINQQIWIADGHHRYESSARYKHQQKEINPNHSGTEAYNFHMMWLTNTVSSDLGIFPTHRLVHSLPDFDKSVFLERIKKYFEVKKVYAQDAMGIAPSDNLWTFVLIFKGQEYLIRLREEKFSEFESPLPDSIKRLDVSVMHYFILEKTLDLKAQKQFENLDFSQYISHCRQTVENEKANFAILTRKVALEEINEVCRSGNTMPAKATYFFPKVLGGLVFSSIQEDEFE